MRNFSNLPLKSKLTSIIMLTSSLILLIATIAFLINDITSLRLTMVGNISTISKVIGNNIIAALTFESRHTAEEILSGLSAEPHVIAAHVFKKDGTEFASYINDTVDGGSHSDHVEYKANHSFRNMAALSSNPDDRPELPPDISGDNSFWDDQMGIVQEIMLDGERIGTLFIKYDLRDIKSRLIQYAGIGAIVFIISLCIGYFISTRFQKIISDPILNLTRAIKGITENKKYSIRVEKQNDDEIGTLVDSFNKMTSDIQNTTISKDYFNNIIKSMYDPLIVIATDYTILMVNSAICDFLDYKEEELVGNPVGHIFDTELLDMGKEVKGIIKTGIVDNQETVYTTKKGAEIPVIFSSSVLLGAKGTITGYVCVARDITERIIAEQQLSEAHKKIVESAHRAGMSDIATGILHNLGNVMNSVNSSVEEIMQIIRTSKVTSLQNANHLVNEHIDNISEFLSTDEKGRKLPAFYLKLGDVLMEEYSKIDKSTKRIEEKIGTMKGIVETQQEYAKAEFHSEQEDLPKIIDDVLKIQKDHIESNNVHVTGDYKKPLRSRVHKYKLIQVLLNLVKNAVESMKGNELRNKKSELTIETGRIDDGKDFIIVTDNGCGIPEENLVKIFNHGFTTKEKGHGFGLHASANAMTEMGGSITVESDGENSGASFTIKLPVET